MIPIDPAQPLTDFRKFLFIVWKHLNLPAPTRRQYALARYLQDNSHDRKVILAFRGMGKSWILAAFVCFVLLHRPDYNIMIVSASKGRADNFTTFVLRLINEMPELLHLKPRNDQRCSKVMFDVGPAPASQSPSVYSCGITGQLSGSRADLVIADDVEIPNNSATQMMREKLSESVKEFDAVLKPGGHIIFLGTPQTEDTLYKKLEERKYRPRVWPVRYPGPNEIEGYKGALAPDILADVYQNPGLAGKSTENTRFPEEELTKRGASYGRAGFAMQFMLRTDLSDEERYPLRLKDLMFFALDAEMAPEKLIWTNATESRVNEPQFNVGMGADYMTKAVAIPGIPYAKYSGVVMAIDPSGRGADETGYAIVAILNSQLFLLDSGGFSGGYEIETLTKLSMLAKQYKVNKIIIEANFGDGMWTQLLRPILNKLHPCATEEVKHSTQKEKRIADVLEPLMNSHRLVVNYGLIEKDYRSTLHHHTEGSAQARYRLFYQLTRLTRERGSLINDDRLDALAMAVAYWSEQMSQDIGEAVKASQEDAKTQALDEFIEHVLGVTPRGLNFYDRV